MELNKPGVNNKTILDNTLKGIFGMPINLSIN